jgi:hypothetical protein
MSRKRNGPLSRQIQAVFFKEERIQSSEATKYKKKSLNEPINFLLIDVQVLLRPLKKL